MAYKEVDLPFYALRRPSALWSEFFNSPAVRWYCRYGIGYRESWQEILAERVVQVDHTTIYRWVQR
jgi:transposase-like protein